MRVQIAGPYHEGGNPLGQWNRGALQPFKGRKFHECA